MAWVRSKGHCGISCRARNDAKGCKEPLISSSCLLHLVIELTRTHQAGAFLPPELTPVPKVQSLGSFASTLNEMCPPKELVAAEQLLFTQAAGNNKLKGKGCICLFDTGSNPCPGAKRNGAARSPKGCRSPPCPIGSYPHPKAGLSISILSSPLPSVQALAWN